MEENFFDKLRNYVRLYMEKGGSHEFSHVERVYNLATKIAKEEKADLDIVRAASLLHDIARSKEDKKEINCHAEEGAKMAKEFLEKTDFSKEKIKGVTNCIRVHRYSLNLKAMSKEEQILQDADQLDALGAIAIARIFSYGGKQNRPIHDPNIPPKPVYISDAKTSINHFYEKILKIKPETFNTELARNIAKQRYNFILKFLKQFHEEWDGKK